MAANDKYSHLLMPLRDLAGNWGIDVARELEDYLGTLQTLEVRGDLVVKALALRILGPQPTSLVRPILAGFI